MPSRRRRNNNPPAYTLNPANTPCSSHQANVMDGISISSTESAHMAFLSDMHYHRAKAEGMYGPPDEKGYFTITH